MHHIDCLSLNFNRKNINIGITKMINVVGAIKVAIM